MSSKRHCAEPVTCSTSKARCPLGLTTPAADRDSTVRGGSSPPISTEGALVALGGLDNAREFVGEGDGAGSVPDGVESPMPAFALDPDAGHRNNNSEIVIISAIYGRRKFIDALIEVPYITDVP